jgi:hypothetical protein
LSEFEHYIELSAKYLRKVDTKEVVERIRCEGSRNGLLCPAFNHLKSFGTSIKTIIDAASSDEGSDELISFPSVAKVSTRIMDLSLVNLTDYWVDTPHLPGFIVAPIDLAVKAQSLTDELRKRNIFVLEVQVVQFNAEYPRAAILWFDKFPGELAMQGFEMIKQLKNRNIEGLEGVQLVKWVDYKALYPELPFFAVVLRGLHKKVGFRELNKFMPVSTSRTEIRIVSGVGCAVVVLTSAADVCLVCQLVHKTKDQYGELVKAHVHPLTQRKHSRLMVETLICDLPKLSSAPPKESLDVFTLLQQRSSTKATSLGNPLQTLIKPNQSRKK